MNLESGVLPPFLGTPEKLKAYKKKLEKIALANYIDWPIPIFYAHFMH